MFSVVESLANLAPQSSGRGVKYELAKSVRDGTQSPIRQYLKFFVELGEGSMITFWLVFPSPLHKIRGNRNTPVNSIGRQERDGGSREHRRVTFHRARNLLKAISIVCMYVYCI